MNGHNMNILALSLSYNVVWFCELPSDYQIIYSCSVSLAVLFLYKSTQCSV